MWCDKANTNNLDFYFMTQGFFMFFLSYLLKQLGDHDLMCHDFVSLNFLASDLVQLEIGRGYTTQGKDIFVPINHPKEC